MKTNIDKAQGLLAEMAKLLANQYSLKVSFKIEDKLKNAEYVVDSRMPEQDFPSIDVCTDGDNCNRCKAPIDEKHKHFHAGITL